MKVKLGMIDKQLRFKGILMKALTQKSSEAKYIASAKSAKKALAARAGKNIDGLRCGEEWIPRRGGNGEIRIRIYRSPGGSGAAADPAGVPGILWLHGGGYSLGIPELNTDAYKNLIAAHDCVIVAPDYRLSIDAPYPAALDDAYDTLLWMQANAARLGIRDDQLMAGGESAGGGLCAALSLYARDRGEVNLAFQMPLYPMIDDRMQGESAQDNNAPIWDSNSNRWAWKLYLGELHGGDVPQYAAADRAEDYRGLPPTVTFAGELEPFRDETVRYAERLREAGVPVEFELYPGCYHAFDMMVPKADVSRRATAFFMRAYKHAAEHYFAAQPGGPAVDAAAADAGSPRSLLQNDPQ
ncbi:alpha/beta hydrolase [Saccharibacillus sp. CPCC 101409]|uniref:alpha/beta hydrolase n=1 Tax=Saccharibacillus sp. CPCC 101409 TaxID=3058041 RepID=UPI00267277EE|nr:alpha/beta hydrolase [Saccharibacillus sp. CPCC 101409]MDO3409806.1 alpha/beta hydrolase [Saccharibacillus sp. CPCC 101409]